MKTVLKKLTSVVLAVVMVFGAAPLSGLVGLELPQWLKKTFGTIASSETEGIFDYEIAEGKAMITDCDETVRGTITIPSTLGGYP